MDEMNYRGYPIDINDPNLVLYLPLWDLKCQGSTFYSVNRVSPSACVTTGTTQSLRGRDFVAASNDVIDCGTADGVTDITTGDFCIGMWVKRDRSATTEYLCSKRDGSVGYEIYMSAGDAVSIFIGDAGGFTTGSMGTTGVSSAIWTFIIVDFDRSGNASLFQNGSVEANTVDISSRSGSLSNADQFGLSDSGAYYDGMIGDVFEFSRILTISEKNNIYNSSKWRYI